MRLRFIAATFLAALTFVAAFAADPQEPLSARIVIPPGSKLENRLFDAELELANNTDRAIRVCTRVVTGRGVSKDGKLSIAHLTPENWQSDPPSAQEIAQATAELAPGKSVRIPFRALCKKSGKIELTAEYKVPEERVPAGKNIWTGHAESTVKLDVTEESVKIVP